MLETIFLLIFPTHVILLELQVGSQIPLVPRQRLRHDVLSRLRHIGQHVTPQQLNLPQRALKRRAFVGIGLVHHERILRDFLGVAAVAVTDQALESGMSNDEISDEVKDDDDVLRWGNQSQPR